MGEDKAFLQFQGEPLLARQIRLLRDCGAREVLISGRHGTDYEEFGVAVVYDETPEIGPLGGLIASLAALQDSMLLVLAVDMPAITSAILTSIVEASTAGVGAAPFDGFRFQPLAAIYPRTILALARSNAGAGRYSMQSLVTAAVEVGQMSPLPIRDEEQHLFLNCNSPDEWKSLVRQH